MMASPDGAAVVDVALIAELAMLLSH